MQARGPSISNLSPREHELLAKYTFFAQLGTQHKGALVTALSFGATLDKSGKLIINNPTAREKLASSGAAKFLYSKPELVSPLTKKVELIFRNVKKRKLARGRRKWFGPQGLSPAGQKQARGRWPHSKRK